MTQSTSLGSLPSSGGAVDGGAPAGDTMAVNAAGNLIATNTYGNDVSLFTPQGGTPALIGTISNPNGVAVDSANNLYIGVSYNSMVVKIPYVNGAYAALAATSSTTPNCTGAGDTVECIMSNITISGGSGVVSMVFDSKGDLFFGTTNNNQGGSNPNSIYECTAACLYSGSPAPTLLFKEPTSSTPNTTGQLSIGGMAIDASGNLFFTDSAMGATSNQESFTSNVNELPYTSGTGYAAAPTAIYTYTPATPANYDAEIDGVATSPNGTVYALLQNTGGILAFPNVGGIYSNKTMYLVSTQSGKLMTSDGLGNLYIADNGGNIYRIAVDNLSVPTSAVGTPSTATNITTILNDGACGTGPLVTFAATGTAASQFAAATTGTCSATYTGGGVFATTLTFTPTTTGINTATITATDSNKNTGAATATGIATGTVASPTFSVAAGTYTSVQSVTLSDATVGASIYYTTNGSTPTASSTLYSGAISVGASETINAIGVDSGDLNSSVATAAYIINLAPPANTPVFSVVAGTYTSPQLVTLSDGTAGSLIYYTTDGSTPTASSTLYVGPVSVSKTETLNAIAIATGFSNSAVATAAYTINLAPSAFQNVVMSQSTSLGALPSSGGAQSGGEPAGDTMAVNAAGNLIATNTYGNDVSLFTPQGGTPALIGTISNPNGVAVDSANNLYIGVSYNSMVVKIPYVNGAYAALAATTSTTPNCKGSSDTVECIMSNITISGGSGVVSMVFDSKGDLFFGTTNNNQGGSNPNSIYECAAACLYSGSPAPTLLFKEPTSSTPNTTGQLSIGGMAIDASGNLFFTDSAMGATSNQESFTSNVNELPYTSGTGYAAAPTVIYTYTPATPANYDAEIDGVATSPNGTVYALLQNTGGILAFPNVGGIYSNKTMYLVSTQSGKLMTSDGLGNLYIADNGGNIYRIALNNFVGTTTPSGTPSTATNITTFLNDGGCSPAPTVTFAATGTSAAAFSAATTGTCTTTLTGGSFATTLTFTPSVVGTSSATLTATDTAKNSGSATVTATATGTVAAPTFSVATGTYTSVQSVTLSDATVGASIYYTTNGSTPTASSTLYSGAISVGASETINAIGVDSGDVNSPVASAVYTINLPGIASPPTFSVAGGTYASPQQVTLSDSTAGTVIYFTTDGSTPTVSSNIYSGPIAVAKTETVNAIAAGPGFTASAVATAAYTINLAPSAFQNVVMSQSTSLGSLPSSGGAQSGGEPAGDTMAVNAAGNLIATNTYGNDVSLFTPQGGTPALIGTISNPNGVAVDSANNLYIGVSYNSMVVKIPYVNGAYAALAATTSTTPNCKGSSDTVECIMSNITISGGSGVVSMVFDSKGDLFFGTTNNNQGGSNPNSIYECAAACLYSGSPAPTLLFKEPTSSTPNTTGQLSIGGMAIDASGNLFFTDSAMGATSNQESFTSNVNELPYTSGTGYAAAPTVIYTYTPATPANYDAEIDGVATSPNGTVYALLQNTGGILAFPNVGGIYSNKTMYLVSTQSGKLMTSDGLGNLYIADNGGNTYRIGVDNLSVPTAPVGNPSTATNVTTLLNDGGCSPAPTVTFAATGTSAAAFSAATTGTCTTTLTGGSLATTLTFTPISVGTNGAAFTATDSLKNNGVALVSGVGTPAPPAGSPTFSVAAGTYTTVQTVTISDTTTGAAIYYTTNGSTPTSSSTLYSGPITVAASETITAIATATGYAPSPVASVVYTINLPPAASPTFSVTAGTYTTPQTITISDTTTGATIYYTTNGTAPTSSSTKYTGPITVGVTETISAIATPSSTAINFVNSAVTSATYTINLPTTATPTFSVAAGPYVTVETVVLGDATAGAKIYYTTNGTNPTTGSTLYTGPLTIASSATIEAIAVDPPNYNNSVVATAIYVITLPPPAFTITSSPSTVSASAGSTGTATLTLTANAAFNGSIAFSCSGFLPVGASCAFSPATVSNLALATSQTTLTVTVPQTTADLHRGPSPLFAGTMFAALLGFFSFRTRRRLQLLLLLVVSAIGLNMFTGCATTATSRITSSQFVVTATGGSCPVTSLNCATAPGGPNPTAVSESLPLVLTTQ